MNPELFWGAMGGGLVAYVLFGGADFGGGVWDLLAFGPRKAEQRRAIEHAIAPIWEANHVWLIFVIVVLFTVFPRAFAAIGIALHIPITLALVGIVLRGAAFTFRAYGLQTPPTKASWGRIFAWSSLVTPVFLGMSLGALSTGDIRWTDGQVTSGFLAGWLSPFAIFVGLFALGLFSLLAAVYLTAETKGAVQEDFRRRAIATELVAGFLAFMVWFLAKSYAPDLYVELAQSVWTWPVQIATALSALATLGLLYRRQFWWARATVAVQVGLVVLGWGLAMDGHLIRPDLHLANAGARNEVMTALPGPLLLGTLLLVPSLWFLFRVFKSKPEA